MEMPVFSEQACDFGSVADLVRSNAPSAIFRRSLEEVVDDITVFRAKFPASEDLGRSGWLAGDTVRI